MTWRLHARLRTGGQGRHAGRRDGTSKQIRFASALNMAMTVVSALVGLAVARILGPSLRGEYAAVTAWYGVSLVVGEVGQPAAICYFVAHDPDRARRYIATSRTIMVTSGLMLAVVGEVATPWLAHGSSNLVFGYRLLFAMFPVTFVSASYTFALQARHIRRWMRVRAVQPFIYALIVAALWLSGHLVLRAVFLALAGSVLLQAVAARQACRREGLTGGRYSSLLRHGLLLYGFSQLLATTPTTLNTSLDQLVLSQMVRPADLGRYAVAVGLTSVAYPLVSPIGSVLFPVVARARRDGAEDPGMVRRAIWASAAIAGGAMLVVSIVAPWLISAVLGPRYAASVPLVWVLAPGGVIVSVNQVAGDLLRGQGRPLAVAAGQGVGALATLLLLFGLVPTVGVMGAAIASTVSYGVAGAILLPQLFRHQPGMPATARAAG